MKTIVLSGPILLLILTPAWQACGPGGGSDEDGEIDLDAAPDQHEILDSPADETTPADVPLDPSADRDVAVDDADPGDADEPESGPCGARNESALIFVGDFETGDLSGYHPSGNTPEVTSLMARNGTYAMLTSLDRYEDPVSYRTEIVPDGQETYVGDELWYGFSIFLPDDYVVDPIWEIVAQWHGRPDFDIGEDWRNPVMALSSDDGVWSFVVRWDSKENTFESGERVYDGTDHFDFGPYETGKWTDWVIHVLWSYGEDGVLQIWKDGELLVDRAGPNAFNDAEGPYFKMGIYKGWSDPDNVGDVDSRLLYHDELRIGGPEAVYCDVAP